MLEKMNKKRLWEIKRDVGNTRKGKFPIVDDIKALVAQVEEMLPIIIDKACENPGPRDSALQHRLVQLSREIAARLEGE